MREGRGFNPAAVLRVGAPSCNPVDSQEQLKAHVHIQRAIYTIQRVDVIDVRRRLGGDHTL